MKLLLPLFTLFFFLFSVQSISAKEFVVRKLITVDIKNQTLYAWENDTAVLETKVSTGLVKTPTPTGVFRIYKKLPLRNMRGYSIVRGAYYLPNVPHVMYFLEGGYAVHGTYWHGNFGNRMSNGCINLSRSDAAWLYEWTQIYTPIVIY